MAGEQMWVALLQDITFLLPSSPPERYQPALKKCPPPSTDPSAMSHCHCSNSFLLVSDPRVGTQPS